MAIARALAKSHGDGAAAAEKAIEPIRGFGFAVADATTSVQKLIIADIGLDKAPGLAKIAESLKQQAGGVFDALLTKSQCVWKAIGNSFKTAILTAIKEVVRSRVAAMLMQMFTGQKVSFAGGGAGPGGGGGMLGGLGGLLGVGAEPVFNGGPIPGGAAGGWGTPPYAGGRSRQDIAAAGPTQ
ncbi:MAG: hypothetical protein HYZ57_16665 [Acidobacteria bacterium]|nr:hypothetical protein [Acidobacteriota bacterium]